VEQDRPSSSEAHRPAVPHRAMPQSEPVGDESAAVDFAATPLGVPPAGASPAPDGERLNLLARGRGVSALERKLLTQAEADPKTELLDLRREVEGLRRLLEVSRDLSSILDHDALLGAILDSAIVLTGAERGLLLLSEQGHLNVILGRGSRQDSLDPQASRVSETLARQCLEQNRVIPHDNISILPELREVRSIKALDLFSAVCVPLRERGAAIGVLYLDTALPGLRTSPQELALLEAFAAHASISFVNARLHGRLEESRVLLARENEDLRAEARERARFGNILGRSRPMLNLFEKIRLLKDADIPVLLLGQSGTGKELVARALHYEGLRHEGPFVPINCAGFTETLLESTMFGHRRGAFTGALQDTPGYVEQAENGTLFMDEVGDMPLALQVKLLRFLESGEFRRLGENQIRRSNSRVISATNQDLTAMVKEKTFREDLYFRLAGVRLEIPPLSERRDDIPILIEHFLAEARLHVPRTIAGMTDRARTYLMRHPWPGNVRQLKFAIEGACALVPEGQAVDEAHLRMQFPDNDEGNPTADCGSLRDSMARLERDVLESALGRHDWNITKAALQLGISRQHLHNRIRVHELQRPGIY
jgi:transcriptional regulator with GAF, ATPase, and Fis domain